jgi:integrase
MSGELVPVVADYLAHKRALGRKFATEEANLRLLQAFAEQRGVIHVEQLNPTLLDAFFTSRPRSRPRSFNHLVGIVGCFLDWAVAQEILAASPLRTPQRRQGADRIPFLFDPTQARAVLSAAACLPDNARAQGRGMTYHAVFALCYGLGLRAGEACGLRVGDVDAGRSLLIVRGGKFGKTRLVPHGPRIAELLARQLERRGCTADDPVFSFGGQRRCLHPGTASQVFHRLVTALDFPVPEGTSPPCLHSLRHSFAVGCLLRWYREGVNPNERLFRLSTFMGHVDPASTAVYLTITPALLDEASRRFEAYAWTKEPDDE